MMIHSIGLCNTFISQMFPYPASRNGCSRSSPRTSQDQAILANSWLQRTNHLWESSLEHSFQEQQHGCFRFPHQTPPQKKKKKTGASACGMCVFSMFFCMGIFLCNEIFILFAHRLWEKKHARELTCPPYKMMFLRVPRLEKVLAVRCEPSPGGFLTPELQNPLLPSLLWLPLGSHLRAWDLSHWVQTQGGEDGEDPPDFTLGPWHLKPRTANDQVTLAKP